MWILGLDISVSCVHPPVGHSFSELDGHAGWGRSQITLQAITFPVDRPTYCSGQNQTRLNGLERKNSKVSRCSNPSNGITLAKFSGLS